MDFPSLRTPRGISDLSLQIYLKLKEHLVDYHEPNTFEADMVKWLMVLMESTFGAHTELLSSDSGGITFESIRREQYLDS